MFKVQSSKFKVQMVMIGVLCVVLGGCQTRHRGYVFPADLDTLVPGITTTTQLVDEIGAPQVKTLYGDTVWIYYGADEKYRGPLPRTYKNKTALLAWVNGTRVTRTQVLHDDDFQRVRIASGETEIPAAIELNALQELFNNIGRFTPAGLGQ